MLQQFTWQHFLIAALILTLIWYLGIFLFCYWSRVTNFCSKPHQPEKLQREWDEELEDDTDEDNLMGRPQQPEGMSSISMDAIRFAPDDDKDTDRDTQLGIIPDLLEELKSIFHILQVENGTKEEFISLFKLISSKYSRIKGTPNQPALNEYIRENVAFNISHEELDELWHSNS